MKSGSNNIILLNREWRTVQNATRLLHLSLQINRTDPRLRVPALIGDLPMSNGRSLGLMDGLSQTFIRKRSNVCYASRKDVPGWLW